MTVKGWLLAAVLTFILTGCASMSPQECEVSDWHAVGFTDGSKGLAVSQFDSYRKDCGEHGIRPNFEAYRSGRSEGLHEFCLPERAFELGARGGSNPGVCPSELNPAFSDAFQSGRYLHELRSSLYKIERRMSLKNERQLALQAQQYEIEAQLLSAQPTMEQRLQLLLELKNLADELHALEDELLELEDEHAYHQQRLAAYEVSLYQSS